MNGSVGRLTALQPKWRRDRCSPKLFGKERKVFNQGRLHLELSEIKKSMPFTITFYHYRPLCLAGQCLEERFAEKSEGMRMDPPSLPRRLSLLFSIAAADGCRMCGVNKGEKEK